MPRRKGQVYGIYMDLRIFVPLRRRVWLGAGNGDHLPDGDHQK